MKFSIIVLCYCNFDNIFVNLSSIMKQLYRDFEVIIADDKSSNFPKDEIISYFEKNNFYDYKILQNDKNLGTVANYDNAIRQSKGDIIIPLSQDDYFKDDNVLTDLNKEFNKGYNIMMTQRISLTKNKPITPTLIQKIINKQNVSKCLKLIIYRNFYCGATIYFRKEFYYNMGGFDFDFKLIEDLPFVLKCLLCNQPIYFYKRETIFYNDKMTKISKQRSINTLNTLNKIFNKYLSNSEYTRLLKKFRRCNAFLVKRMNCTNKFSIFLNDIMFADVAIIFAILKVKNI